MVRREDDELDRELARGEFAGKWIVVAAAVVNGARVVLGFLPRLTWKPHPTDPQLSRATWMAAEVLHGAAVVLCMPLAVLLGVLVVASWCGGRGRQRLPNLCRSCGYDRAGIKSEATCPECGELPR